MYNVWKQARAKWPRVPSWILLQDNRNKHSSLASKRDATTCSSSVGKLSKHDDGIFCIVWETCGGIESEREAGLNAARRRLFQKWRDWQRPATGTSNQVYGTGLLRTIVYKWEISINELLCEGYCLDCLLQSQTSCRWSVRAWSMQSPADRWVHSSFVKGSMSSGHFHGLGLLVCTLCRYRIGALFCHIGSL